MGGTTLVDAGFLVALLSRRDGNHGWAVAQSSRLPLPWRTCDAVLSEAFHLLGEAGRPALSALLRRGAVSPSFRLDSQLDAVLRLMEKYADLPMGLADACLVRLTEVLPDALVATTDSDFRIYRRHGRRIVPTVMPDGP